MIAHSSTGTVRMPAAMKAREAGNPRRKQSASAENAQRQRRQEAEEGAGKRHFHGLPQSGADGRQDADVRRQHLRTKNAEIAYAAREALEIEKAEVRQHGQQKKAGGGGENQTGLHRLASARADSRS